MGSADYAPASSRDTLLKWDDGEAAHYSYSITGVADAMLAVEFRAPAWAQSIRGLQVYVTEHPGIWPDPGPPDTTCAFAACIWEPLWGIYERPGELILAVNCGSGHPVNEWVEIDLPYLVGLEDLAGYPSGRFFGGVLWLKRFSPAVGIDDTAPVEQMSWFRRCGPWSNIEGANAMVRAVVTDDTGTAVAPTTWTRIKAMFAPEAGRVPN